MERYYRFLCAAAIAASVVGCSHQASVTGASTAPIPITVSHAVVRTIPRIQSAIGEITNGNPPYLTAPARGQLTTVFVRPQESVRAHQPLGLFQPSVRGAGSLPHTIVIRAPFAGTVSAQLVTVGQHCIAGQRIFGFAGPAIRTARLPFISADQARLHIGETVMLHSPLAPLTTLDGTIGALTPNSQGHAIYAFVTLPPVRGWVPGSPVRADVIVGTHQAIIVPRQSVVLRLPGTVVFLIHHHHAYAQPVLVGEGLRHYVQIQSGLRAGTLVAQDGTQYLNNGSRVIIRRADS